jgi:hypothetical protein
MCDGFGLCPRSAAFCEFTTPRTSSEAFRARVILVASRKHSEVKVRLEPWQLQNVPKFVSCLRVSKLRGILPTVSGLVTVGCVRGNFESHACPALFGVSWHINSGDSSRNPANPTSDLDFDIGGLGTRVLVAVVVFTKAVKRLD